MGDELKYRCKDIGKYPDCQGEIVISRKILKLMLEKGEDMPARCENCQKKHKSGKRETRQSYFQQTMDLALGNVAKSDFLAGGFTSHGDRKRSEEFIEPDSSGMRIRITDEHIKELYKKLYENQVVVLASPTGTGKSVYVLYRLLEAPTDYEGDFVKTLIRQGQVIQTQPLRDATGRISETVSEKELGESGVGPLGTLGISHRGRKDYSRHNLGVEVTDGMLVNWLREGHLGQYSLIMVDEAHKRTVNIDKLLMLLQEKLPLYPHLKVIIASATINLEEFKEAFERLGITTGNLDLSKTLKEEINYHVHYWKSKKVKDCDCWMCTNDALREKFWSKKDIPPEEAELPEIVSSFVMEILQHTEKGGILVFLTGEAVIKRTEEILKGKLKRISSLRKVPVLSIYSRLESEVGEGEVTRRFNYNPEDKRVLLTTDIAETSHTLKDIVYVIESGYIKQFEWDPQDLTSTLPTIRHSQAGCRQRFGRVGRTQKGYVYCLYSEGDFEGKFKMQTTPESFRSPLPETHLMAKAAGVSGELKFIGSPDDRNKFNLENKRALSTISDEGYIDEIGNITEDGIDIFHIPISPEKKALLDLADEQGCFLEMMTFLLMIETDKSDPRTGAEVFNLTHGLLVWDPRWTAATKLSVWRIHEALKTGCIDDLDFVLKLAVCYLNAQKRKKEKQWTEQNFLNFEAFENIFKTQRELMEIFLLKAEEQEMRELDIALVNKLRLILANVLKGRVVKIANHEGTLVYKFQEEEVCGIVHDACVGAWQEGDSALLITATKKRNILDGQQKPISHTCSLVRLESQIPGLSQERFFDQRIFVGSRVLVIEEGEFSYIGEVLQAPAQINVEYGEKLDFAMLMDDYLRKNYKPSIIFSEEEAKESFKDLQGKVRLIWQDERRTKDAKVISWKMDNDFPCAVVVPFDEREIFQKIGEHGKAEVKIERVFKGPEDRKGWVLTRTTEGVEFPVESSDLSLSYLDYGLKCLEGNQMVLSVKRVSIGGMPTLSNINNIISGLRSLKQEIVESGKVEIKATIGKIDLDRNMITVFVVNDDHSVYSFLIRSRTIPATLKIGDKVPVTVALKEERCYIDCSLEDYQVESLPQGSDWKYDLESERLFFSYFLDEEKIKYFDVDTEFKEKMVKNSWNYGFIARIGSTGR